MTTDTLFCGFRLVSITSITALSARAHLFRHEKTGTELMWLDRPTDNKTFAVAFQTLPEDDTGVFHILEHSVLCGSEKYPVKAPFVELMKGSLHTFLNAMTFPDKTIYPISSRNEADFRNLMAVYLDAVFRPSIYRNPHIFQQEGWHYELDGQGQPRRVGVVLGEMKGVFSSVDEIIQREVNRMLYPDCCYRFCYGGDPEHIPELTYQRFLDAHRRFYHPSNARLFLDGAMDIEAILAYIDQEYLQHYDRQTPDFSLKEQPPIPGTSATIPYEIAADESKERKSHFVMSKVAGSWQNVEKLLALEVLVDYLASSNSAPLTRAVLEQDLGKSVQLSLADDIPQPCLTLQIRNCSENDLPKMKHAIQDCIRGLLEAGLDKEALTASLNRLEFLSQENREPFGVELAIRACRSWMYGGDPCLYLDLSPTFVSLRCRLEERYFSNLLEEIFLQEKGQAVLHVIPSDTLGREKLAAEQERLAAAAAAWSPEERSAVETEQRKLAAWQQSVDTPAALASIPHLSREDLSLQPLWIGCDEEAVGTVRILRPRVSSPGTVYLNLYFALPEMELQDLSALSLLPRLLGSLPTRDHDRQALQQEVKTYLGSLDFDLVPIGRNHDPDHAVCYLLCSCGVLERNLGRAVSLIREVLLETELDRPEEVEAILQQVFTVARQGLITSGHQYAARHALAGLTAEDAALEAVGGYGCYRYLKAAAEHFVFDSVLPPMEHIMRRLSRLPLTISVTGKVNQETLDALCAGFDGDLSSYAPTITLPEYRSCRDAITIPAEVAYAVLGGNLRRAGGEIHGSYGLAAKILSLNYLWNEVRVQGGAYGAGMGVRGNGDVFCYSYRDPNPARSLAVYREAPEYLRRFCREQASFDELLIGAVSDQEPLMAVSAVSRQAAEQALRGATWEEKQRERRELLDASPMDLLHFADLLEEIGKKPDICVVGGAPLLDRCEEHLLNRV